MFCGNITVVVRFMFSYEGPCLLCGWPVSYPCLVPFRQQRMYLCVFMYFCVFAVSVPALAVHSACVRTLWAFHPLAPLRQKRVYLCVNYLCVFAVSVPVQAVRSACARALGLSICSYPFRQ